MKAEGFTYEANDLRRKFNNLLSTYKQLKDHHEGSGKYVVTWGFPFVTNYAYFRLLSCLPDISGRNRVNFKYERDFDEAFAEISTMDIDAIVDDSAE